MTLPNTNNTTRPVAAGYQALLTWGAGATDNMYLQLAVNPERRLTITTAQPDTPLPNLADVAEEVRSQQGRIFALSSFENGEGLAFAHRADNDEFDARRYWDSTGISVEAPEPGDPSELTLLNATSKRYSFTGTSDHLQVAIRPSDNTVFYPRDQYVDQITSNVYADITIINDHDLGSEVFGVAAVGDLMYAITSTQLYSKTGAGAFSTLGSSNGGDGLWAAKNRLFEGSGQTLYEVDVSTGTRTTLKTLASGQTWSQVIDAGSAILAASSDGYIYVFTLEESSLVLQAEFLITEGDVPVCMAHSQGIVLVGTKQDVQAGGTIGRLWVGELVGVRLRNTQLIREWGDEDSTATQHPFSMASTRDHIFIGVRGEAWQYQLATAGLSRYATFTDSNPVGGMAPIDERIFYLLDGSGGWRTDDTPVASGYMISPLADFLSASKKAWVGMRVDHDAIVGDEQIDVYYTTTPAAIEDKDHADWTLLKSITSGQFTDEESMSAVFARYLAFQVVLTAGSSDERPVVRSVSFRALQQSDDEVVDLPVNVSDWYERPNRQPVIIRGRGDEVYQQLKSLQGEPVTLKLLRNGDQIRGQLVALQAPVPALTPRGSMSLFATIRVRGVVL
ncbi:MAG: hypothetical protein R3320_12035 [Nitriliruptorales bacterium]|nr:hypothetical protein [Nitriliruptorales bacterium]